MADDTIKKKILVVDDDKSQLAFAEELLQDEFDVFTAKSGKDALEKLYGGFTPDAILLDILMPEMDGREVFNRIKAVGLTENVPIIFLTALDEYEREAYELGAAGFIKKPYKKELLTNSIKVAIAKYLVRQYGA
jgi:putative two-component system response regulator